MKNNHKHYYGYGCVMEGIVLGASVGAAAAMLAAPRAQKAIKKAGSVCSQAHEKTDEILGYAAETAESKLQKLKAIVTSD